MLHGPEGCAMVFRLKSLLTPLVSCIGSLHVSNLLCHLQAWCSRFLPHTNTYKYACSNEVRTSTEGYLALPDQWPDSLLAGYGMLAE